MRRTCLFLIHLLPCFGFAAAEPDLKIQPRLVVGIVIDQMRYDYLYRYYDQYSDNGFKRLLREGMSFTYAQYNYVPTYTAPGHASIYTGTTPYYHGIISNGWYDRKLKRYTGCLRDTSVRTVGAENRSGRVSPANLLTGTMTDQLRMSNNGLSKVYSVSLKDRGAVLPGGHMANAAYWYDGSTGNFVTSTWYRNSLPEWVRKFNNLHLPSNLMKSPWQTEAGKNFETSYPDAGPGEEDVFKEGKTTFPHRFDHLNDSLKLQLIRNTPFGNDLLTEFVLQLLSNEKPGGGTYCDFLAISFSATDYVGHAYGPNSMEVMDTYLKLDRQLARILDSLDLQIGKGNYLLFLTADHAVKPNTGYLQANNMSYGSDSAVDMEKEIKKFCGSKFGTGRIIEAFEDNQIYLNYGVIDSLKLPVAGVTERISSFLKTAFPFIGPVISRSQMTSITPTRSMNSFILNGFNLSRSGDLFFELNPDCLSSGSHDKGTTHESSYDYDTHVPLIFFGWHVEHGESNEPVYVEDIAPTVTTLIHIQEPEATIGVPILK